MQTLIYLLDKFSHKFSNIFFLYFDFYSSKYTPSEDFSKKILKSGIVEACVNWAKYKAEEKLGKMQKGTKKNKITGIPKLEDANEAGRYVKLYIT
jgi:hypothetical protein